MPSLRRRAALLFVVLLVGAGGRSGLARGGGDAQTQTPAPAQPAQAPAPAAPPAPAPQPPEQPIFRAGINFVRVDVIVTDRNGLPVADLTAADFELAEDGKAQTVETFRLVKIDSVAPVETASRLTTRADEETAAQDEDARIVVFFLDDYHVRLGNSMAARKHLVEFVNTQLGPRDLVAVMYPLSPLDSVTLTRDHAQVMRALERFQGRKFDYTPRNALEDRYANYPTETVERIRRQVSLSALQGLAVKLGALREGRKAVLLVSEGYVAMLPPQMRGPIATMPGIGNPQRNNPFAGDNNFNEDRSRFIGELDVQTELQQVFDAANRSNTAIYAVDPRGLSTGEFDIQDNISMRSSQESLRQTQNTLRTLADETDGRAIINRNDLARGMQQLVRDSSAYYLLGYNSTQSPSDGKFHEIRVRVKRPGLQVRARKGYWALTATETLRATAPPKPGPPPAVAKSLAGIAGGYERRLVRTWIGTAPGDSGRTRVTFVWEAIPPPPGSGRTPVGRVLLTALDGSGAEVFRGTVGEPPAEGPLRGGTTLDVPPGKLSLRLAIEGKPDEVLDTDDRSVEVPDFTEPKARLVTPRVYVARSAREFQAIRGDPAAPPAATREFRRTERLFLRLDAVAPGGGDSLTYTARLLNRQGDRMTDLPVTTPADGGSRTVDFPLSSLPAGEFLIEIGAKSADGAEATELVAFRMVG
ncbi:MAG: VWA domain-containing protein [Vicinamibacterales bacterium]